MSAMTPEEDQRVKWLKRCVYNNQNDQADLKSKDEVWH